MRRKGTWLFFIVLAGATVGIANADPVTIPNTFTAGQPAVAAEVNANFDAVKIAVDDNDSRVTVNTADLTSLLARITALEVDNAALQNFKGGQRNSLIHRLTAKSTDLRRILI